MPERIAFRMIMKAGQAEEYKKRHDHIWPELSQELRDAGISDYSIWLDPETNHLFATLVRSDNHGMDKLADSEVNKRWADFMSDIMEFKGRYQPVVAPLEQVFHLK